ncbi:bifunctional alpha,alpha-trehalose-phosphate synthase (UDP-forming)/trehalose-phosphatase [bacterium]|nr:MAG: bifunctional alpha,alpha-trehalose-phosphate synthase (UDP-forming)/trehalose-phosphatase [bacterium]
MRLLVVSNRLPVTVAKKNGKLVFQKSAGGLVSGISSYLESLKSSSSIKSEHLWVGWAGATVTDRAKEKLKSEILSQFQCLPVFIPESDMDSFYHGFCNKTIWPLFHYFPSRTSFKEEDWHSYKTVNRIFCDALVAIIRPGDLVWVHDYHLMLLPKLLRERISNLPIGFFLHIPFPSFELFRLLPRSWSREILEGLLGANLVGFHIHDYTQYFLRCVLRILGLEHNMGIIVTGDHLVKAATFPMGINFERFHDASGSREVQEERGKLRNVLEGYRVILSIDRLDYTKGVINRLEGYELFLEKNSQWRRKVVLILVVVPSRIGVDHYQQAKREIDELVGRINGRFGSIGWVPISYQYASLPFHRLVALYNSSDIALVTPLRDGMNLIAKEYIAARTDKTGVLILSEMAGAARELGEALIINPNDKREIAEALNEALGLSTEEQVRRNEAMQNRLRRYDVSRWAEDFINDMLRVTKNQETFYARMLTPAAKEQLLRRFQKSEKRLILLDYDGTLAPFTSSPHGAKPTDELLSLLRALSENAKSEVVLISGRDRDTLQRWFAMFPIGLAAEHGIWIKEKDTEWSLIKPLTNSWIAQIRPMLETYVDRLPGSFIEEKEFSVAWHYRMADPDQSALLAKELADSVISFTANMDIQVRQGHKVLEIKSAGVNKGTAGLHWMSKKNYDFVMAMGDDWTDEDLFKICPETAHSIRIGVAQSYAKYNLRDHLEALELLQKLVRSETGS